MPRTRRINDAQHVYHVLNRGAKKAAIFESVDDYRAFELLLIEARARFGMRVLAYCLMPNHWHLLLWPRTDGSLSLFVQWLTATHAIRWNRVHGKAGEGAVYQARFKSIPIERGPHLYWAWRYVERNALRANLVSKAEDWRWGSLWQRRYALACYLDDAPVPIPDDWLEVVNLPQSEGELTAFRTHVRRGEPYGGPGWPARQPCAP